MNITDQLRELCEEQTEVIKEKDARIKELKDLLIDRGGIELDKHDQFVALHIPKELLPKDPNFQTPKYSVEDLTEVCIAATTIYKNTQYPSQVQPFVHNLLAQLPKDTIMKAIKNVSMMFDLNGRPHDKRPNFGNQFATVTLVKEMAETAVKPVATGGKKSSDYDNSMKKWASDE